MFMSTANCCLLDWLNPSNPAAHARIALQTRQHITLLHTYVLGQKLGATLKTQECVNNVSYDDAHFNTLFFCSQRPQLSPRFSFTLGKSVFLKLEAKKSLLPNFH